MPQDAADPRRPDGSALERPDHRPDDRPNDRPANLALEDQLCFALYSAANAIIRTYRPMLRDIGLTYPQYLALLVLWQADTDSAHDPISVGTIAERLSLPGHAITPLLRRLEQAGLITRRRDRRDQRVVSVALTAQGRALEFRAAAVQAEVVERTRLCPPEFQALRTDLHQLSSVMGTPVPATDDDSAGADAPRARCADAS